MIRKTIQRKCSICNLISSVRKDGAGKNCRKCQAKLNHKLIKPKNIQGLKYGKLLVISLSHVDKQAYWKCKCDCGNECIIQGNRLRSGKTQSCGCIIKTQKGLSNSPAYRSWHGMIQRCYDTTVSHYKRYGAKGIHVCDRWKNSFHLFLLDMGERPLGKTLDRIDSNQGYFPENCRWASTKEQARNNRHNIIAFGEEMSLIDWSIRTGINWSTIRRRIISLGWEPEVALTKPVGKYAIKKR